MSIHRSIQTGLLVGNTLQTAALRSQVAKMQHLIEDQQQRQQQQQDQLGAMRQIVFEAGVLLDTAQDHLQSNPVLAVYASRIAFFNLLRPTTSNFNNLSDKQALYQNRRRADVLLARGEALIPEKTAQDLYRLAWLEQIRLPLFALKTWIQITEKIQSAAILFYPSAGLFRGLLIFVGGNILGSLFAGVLFTISHGLGIIAYLSFNGISLLIADTVARHKLLAKCNAMATQAGGWVGAGMRPALARQILDQARTQLSSWDYKSTATTSNEAKAELANADVEIAQLKQNL